MASGPSVEVGEVGGGSETRGNRERDCDRVGTRTEGGGSRGETIQVVLLVFRGRKRVTLHPDRLHVQVHIRERWRVLNS